MGLAFDPYLTSSLPPSFLCLCDLWPVVRDPIVLAGSGNTGNVIRHQSALSHFSVSHCPTPCMCSPIHECILYSIYFYVPMYVCRSVYIYHLIYDMFSLLLSVSVSLCCYCMYMFTSVTSSSFVLPCLHFMCLTVYMYDSICMVGMCPHISMNSYRSIRCDFHPMFFSIYTFSYYVYAVYVYV